MSDTIDHRKITTVLESLKKVTFNDAFIAETLAAAKAGDLSVEDCFHRPPVGAARGKDSPFALLCEAGYDPDNVAGLSLDDHRSLRRGVLARLLKALPAGRADAPQNSWGASVLECYLRVAPPAGEVDNEVLAGLLGRPDVNVNPPRAEDSPLAFAVRLGRPDLVALLLSVGADGPKDKRALMHAITGDNGPILKLLLDAGALAVHPTRNLRAEAFLYSAQWNKPAALGLLADTPEVGSIDYDGGLANAIRAKAWPCVEVLLGHSSYTPDDSFFLEGSEGAYTVERGITWSSRDAEQSVMANLSNLVRAGLPGETLSGYAKSLYLNYRSRPPGTGRWSLSGNAPTTRQRRAVLGHVLKELGAPACAGLLHAAVQAGAPASDLALICAHAPDQINEINQDGKTPLLVLLSKAAKPAFKVREAQIKTLLDTGGDPNLAGPDGTTAWALARRWSPHLTDLLNDAGAGPPAHGAPRP